MNREEKTRAERLEVTEEKLKAPGRQCSYAVESFYHFDTLSFFFSSAIGIVVIVTGVE